MKKKFIKQMSLLAAGAFFLTMFLIPGMRAEATEANNGFVIEGGVLTGYSGSETDLVIPDSVTTIGDGAFAGKSQITSVAISGNVSIGADAFNGCSSLRGVSLPEGLTEIRSGTFKGCSSLVDITIPSSVTSIGAEAFSNCSRLGGISIPSSVTSIGSSAFYGCSNLSSVSVPSSVTNVGEGVFAGCLSLGSVEFQGQINSIPAVFFYNCRSLRSIAVPSGVASIGTNAFSGCNSLSQVSIPASTTRIDLSAFSNCPNLSAITIAGGNSAYSSQDGCIYNASGTELRYVPQGKGSITLGNGVTTIGSGAFADNKSITNLVLPSSVTSIQDNAFNDSGIKTVTIPESVKNIGSQGNWEPDKIILALDSQAHLFADENNFLYDGDLGQAQDPVKRPGNDNPGGDKPNNGNKPGNNGTDNPNGGNSDTNNPNGGNSNTNNPSNSGNGSTGGNANNGTSGNNTKTTGTTGTSHVKDSTPKTGDRIDARYFLFAGVLLIGVYLLISKRNIKDEKKNKK